MNKKYVFENLEVRMTGRQAKKTVKRTQQTRVSRPPSQAEVMFEITPVDLEEGSWKKWVKQEDLYEIIEPKDDK